MKINNKTNLLLSFLPVITIILTLIIPKPSLADDCKIYKDAKAYVLEKLESNDIVFLGTRHQSPPILNFLSDLILNLNSAGVTHIGLEICSDQQNAIDNFIKTGKGLEKIQLLYQLDCPEYRNMISVIRNLDQGKRQRVVALDLPKSRYDQKISRNEYMAQSISKIFQKVSNAKILVILGSVHVLKKLNWEDHVPRPYISLRSYLKKLQPGLRMFSICQLVGNDPKECDFTREYSSIKGSVALDCDERFAGWETGLMQVMAIKPTAVYDLLDGVIVY